MERNLICYFICKSSHCRSRHCAVHASVVRVERIRRAFVRYILMRVVFSWLRERINRIVVKYVVVIRGYENKISVKIESHSRMFCLYYKRTINTGTMADQFPRNI